MKTDAIKSLIYLRRLQADTMPPLERQIVQSQMVEAAAELAALTRLARLVVNEDGSDGVLVETLETVLLLHKRDHPFVYTDTNKKINQALSDARQAMEARNE